MTKSISALALIAIFSVGCFKHAWDAPNVTAEVEPSYSKWHSHWLFGLIQGTGDVDLGEVCPQGVARIENYQTFVNGLIGALIGIVYHPTTVEVYCATTKSATNIEIKNIDLDALSALQQEYPDLEDRLIEIRDTAYGQQALAAR